LLLIILYIQAAAAVIFRRKSKCMGVILDPEPEVGKIIGDFTKSLIVGMI
jgi:hypothetical protein